MCWKNFFILNFIYGQLRSSLSWNSCDKGGFPIPWFTYPAIEYLSHLDLRDKSVFEYGTGNSTFFWGRNAKKVVCVESDPRWHQRTRAGIPPNVELFLEEDSGRYVKAIERSADPYFDIIVVDGLQRLECCRAALKKLREGGIIILDNSEVYAEAALFLRNSDLIQVDMSGFAPINSYTSTTSFFFHPAFRPRNRFERLPMESLGSARRLLRSPV